MSRVGMRVLCRYTDFLMNRYEALLLDRADEGGHEMSEGVTERDLAMARACEQCAVCNRAREKQRGMAFWIVTHVEDGLCPFCKAYEKVHGRKAHEPAPGPRETVSG